MRRVADRLAAVAPAHVWRVFAAFSAACLYVVAASGGLVHAGVWLQLGVATALVVGLMVDRPAMAAAVAAAAAASGLLMSPTSPLSVSAPWPVIAVAGAAVVAAVIAPFVRPLARMGAWVPWALVVLLVAIPVGNLWYDTLTLNSMATMDPATQRVDPSLNEQLEGAVAVELLYRDDALFRQVSLDVAAGRPYYTSFAERFAEWSGGRAPSSVTNIRFPLIYAVWGRLPGTSIVLAFLSLVTISSVAAVVALCRFVRPPVAAVSAVVLCAYAFTFSVQLVVFTPEMWASCLVIIALALLVWVPGREDGMRFEIAAAVLAVIAVLVREVVVFVPLAGLVAASVERGPRTRARVTVWAVALAVAAAALAVHYYLAAAVVDPSSTYQQFRVGGLANAARAVVYATAFLGDGGLLVWILAVAGLVGVLLVPDTRIRAFLAVFIGGTFAAFLFVQNTGQNAVDDSALNYWGAAVTPLLFACAPLALSLVPSAGRFAVTKKAQKKRSTR